MNFVRRSHGWWRASALVSIVAGALLLLGCTAGTQTPARTQGSAVRARTISVAGVGRARSAPDIARVSLGVEAVSQDISEAFKEANATITATLQALRALGVSEQDIQTQSFTIYVERPQPPPTGTRLPNGTLRPLPPIYHVSNIIEMQVRDVNRTGELIEAAVKAGANSVLGIGFAVESDSELRATARAEAVQDADMTADALANLAGVRLGAIQSITESPGGIGGPALFDRAAAASVPIEPGSLTYTTQVQVVYTIADP